MFSGLVVDDDSVPLMTTSFERGRQRLDVLRTAIGGALMCDIEGRMVGALRPRIGPRQSSVGVGGPASCVQA
jgi:hypothetical protein